MERSCAAIDGSRPNDDEKEAGIIESNPAHGIRKPKDNVRKRRLSEAEYRILGGMLREAAKQEKYATIVDIVRQIALTGSRRSEMIGLKWTEADTEASCFEALTRAERAELLRLLRKVSAALG